MKRRDRLPKRPRRVVSCFARHMERKLRMNDCRGGWHLMRDSYLLRGIFDSARALQSALHGEKVAPGFISGEAADVANFAMMIADNYRRRIKARQRWKRGG